MFLLVRRYTEDRTDPLSGPEIVWIGTCLAAATLLLLIGLAYGMFRGSRVDRRRAFTRAWLESLKGAPRESEAPLEGAGDHTAGS